ncbi:MAG: hypothetical protein U5Q03_19730 [Bacteroidota bacterium]|nr:hypothetical protein [Bacteroidota bacterium]
MQSFVDSVNNSNSVDFVIHAGDFADFGLPKQYTWTHCILSKLRVP